MAVEPNTITTTVTPPAPVNTPPSVAATPIPTTAQPTTAATTAVNNPPVNGDDSNISFDQFEQVRDMTPATPDVRPQGARSEPTTTTTATTTPTATPEAKTTVAPTVVAPVAPNKDELPSLDLELIGDAKTLPTTTAPVVAKVIEGRDYTGLEDNEVDLFKKMSNESFAVLKPAYLEAKTLKPKVVQMEQELKTTKDQLAKVPQQGQLPDSYYEHPASFVLNPDYLQAQSQLQNMQVEKSHWVKQLEMIEAGKKPKQLVKQNGQYYEGEEMPPTAATKAQIMSNLAAADNYGQQANQVANQVAQQHSARYQQEMAALLAYENKTFPWFVEGKDHPYKDFIAKATQQAPPLIRANPILARMFAKSQALFQDMQKQIKMLKQVKAPDTAAQQPLATTAGGGAPQSQTAQPDVGFDEFEKLKYG